MTAICVIGTELSARLQNVLTLAQVAALLIFAAVALIKVYTDNATPESITPEASWFSPFDDRQLLGARLGAPDRGLHLLGLGERRQPDRGDDRLDPRARPRRDGLHARPARDLRRRHRPRSSRTPASAEVEEFDDDESMFSTLGEGVLGSQLGQDRRARHRDLGDLVDADDDHPGLAHDVLDGPRGRVPPSLREHPPPVPNAGLLDDRRGRPRDPAGTCRPTSSPRTSSSTRSRLCR